MLALSCNSTSHDLDSFQAHVITMNGCHFVFSQPIGFSNAIPSHAFAGNAEQEATPGTCVYGRAGNEAGTLALAWCWKISYLAIDIFSHHCSITFNFSVTTWCPCHKLMSPTGCSWNGLCEAIHRSLQTCNSSCNTLDRCVVVRCLACFGCSGGFSTATLAHDAVIHWDLKMQSSTFRLKIS